MEKTIESILYKGWVAKRLVVSYLYNFRLDGDFKSIEETPKGDIRINPQYGIRITLGYPKSIYIPSSRYHAFTSLFDKSIKLIQKNLYQLFPNINSLEFEIDSRTLDRFQNEKAISSVNMTVVPAVYVDNTNQTYPGIRISFIDKQSEITIPLEDALAMNQLFKTFEPNSYGTNLLFQMIKIE